MSIPYVNICCKYPACESKIYRRCENKHFFSFPKKVERCMLWIKACNISFDSVENALKKVKNYRICEDHFVERDFTNSLRKRLNHFAVPATFNCDAVQDLNHTNNAIKIGLSDEDVANCTTPCDSNGHNSSTNKRKADSPISFSDSEYEDCPSDNQEMVFRYYSFLQSLVVGRCFVLKNYLTQHLTKPMKMNIHKLTLLKISKLQELLKYENDKLSTLSAIRQKNYFSSMEVYLNRITFNFIDAQLTSARRKHHRVIRWTINDKIFASSFYKRCPRLYKYMSHCFILPPRRVIKEVIGNIPRGPGLNIEILKDLKEYIRKMNDANKMCVLIFDEIALESKYLCSTHKSKDHVLVFMVRGIGKPWKKTLSYYLTDGIVFQTLKEIIVKSINVLQEVGLEVVGIVCDQKETNRNALKSLFLSEIDCLNFNLFYVNMKPIVIIFDVPHLLISTRDALCKYDIRFSEKKICKFGYVIDLFSFSECCTFKMLKKLRPEHFNEPERFRNSVKIAARQLSDTVAAGIDMLHVTKILPSESLQTAKFINNIDKLFDSLNGSKRISKNGKMLCCAASRSTPHLLLWLKNLKEISNWKFLDKKTNEDVTDSLSLIEDWVITLKSIIFLYKILCETNRCPFLNCRYLNMDPLMNLFRLIPRDSKSRN